MNTVNYFKTSFLSLAVIALVACGGAENQEETSETNEIPETEPMVKTVSHAINPDSSTVAWKGEMLNMYSHEGTVKMIESYVTTEDGELAGGGFIVDLTTITPTDENYNPKEGKSKDKLVGHLSSPDFFDVANHPKASFDITEVMDGKVKGNLSIRDKTNEEIVENVTVEKIGNRMHLTGTLTFDRKKYNVAFEHPVKEMVLSNDIELQLDLMTNPLTE